MQGNLVLTKENEAIAYFSVPSISVAVTDDEKKKKTKQDVAKVLKRLFPQKWFEIALVPKDYRLFEKMKDVESTLATESRPLGVQVLNKTVSG
ncbi:conjugal transfer protein, partial [Carnobacterium maltaromaticum]|nr:conjugal transfer protein [Carnobacterium maltaromaticum]